MSNIYDTITLKQWFKKGAKPTAEQFAGVFDSFLHKNEMLSKDKIQGLALDLKKLKTHETQLKNIQESTINKDDFKEELLKKVDKIKGFGLSETSFSKEEKELLKTHKELIDNLLKQENVSQEALLITLSAYLKKEELPTKISTFENDLEYAKKQEVPTKVSELQNDEDYLTQGESFSLAFDELLKTLKSEQILALRELVAFDGSVALPSLKSVSPNDLAVGTNDYKLYVSGVNFTPDTNFLIENLEKRLKIKNKQYIDTSNFILYLDVPKDITTENYIIRCSNSTVAHAKESLLLKVHKIDYLQPFEQTTFDGNPNLKFDAEIHIPWIFPTDRININTGLVGTAQNIEDKKVGAWNTTVALEVTNSVIIYRPYVPKKGNRNPMPAAVKLVQDVKNHNAFLREFAASDRCKISLLKDTLIYQTLNNNSWFEHFNIPLDRLPNYKAEEPLFLLINVGSHYIFGSEIRGISEVQLYKYN